MKIKVWRNGGDTAMPQRSPAPQPKLPDGKPDAAERSYEDAQDAAFDPRGDRAPDAPEDGSGRKTSR